MATSYQIVDLGYGDAGKGRITDALVRKLGVKLVVRYNGGAQASHNVDTGACHHAFHQFGSGTLAGAATLLARGVLVNPITFLHEDDDLARKGVARQSVYVDTSTRVTTPFHVALNRLREMARGSDRHGSCGLGIGETVDHAIKHPGSVLYAGDCVDVACAEAKLRVVLDDLSGEVLKLAGEAQKAGAEGSEVTAAVATFEAGRLRSYAEAFAEFARRVQLVGLDRAVAMVASQDTVFEGAQGVLIDQDHGFAPYTTWSDTTLGHARSLAVEAGVRHVMRVGVIRPYMVRHGAGPLPTGPCLIGSWSAAQSGLKDHNSDNEWQGCLRYGWLDLPALRYALSAVGGVDTLAVTHLDEIQTLPGSIDVAVADGADGDTWQELAGEERTAAFYARAPIFNIWPKDIYLHRVAEGLGTPVGIETWGPAAGDKIVYNIPGLC